MPQKAIFRLILLFCSNVLMTPVEASYYQKKSEGWHWYKNHPVEVESDFEKIPSKDNLINPTLTPSEIVKSYQKELEARLHKAWVNPSINNLKSYQEMQKDMMQRSQNFSDTWMEVVFNNPQLDHTLVSPVNQKGRHVYLDQQQNIVKETIQGLSEEYGLFFFFSESCEYCHQFAPIVQQFSKNYGWEVIAISADGGSIPGFTHIEQNNGLLERWEVNVLPALFAVNPKTGHVLPIAYGLTSLDQMETRVMALTKNSREDNNDE